MSTWSEGSGDDEIVNNVAVNATPNMEDMYVPGLGVRTALFDETAESPLLLRVGRLRVLAQAHMRHSAEVTSDIIRSMARQTMFIWTRISREIRISSRSAATHLRKTEKRTISMAADEGAPEIRNRGRRLRQITQLHQAAQWQLRLPEAKARLIRCSQQVRSSLSDASCSSRNFLRAVTRRNADFRISLSFPKLLRAAPALAILLLVVVFVIQEVVLRVMQ